MNDAIRNRISKDTLWRLGASLVLALVLWGWVSTLEDPSVKRTFSDLPISIDAPADDLVITTTLPRIAVQVEAPRSVMTPITANQVIPHLDMSGVTKPGVYDLPVKVRDIADVWHIRLSPATVHITVEKMVTATFPLIWEEAPTDGTSLRIINSVIPSADQVTVRGAESAVNQIATVVLPITLDSQLRSFAGSFIPEARDATGGVVENVTITPSPITATVVLTTRGKSVAVLPQVVGRPAEGYQSGTYIVNPSTVVVDGPADLLDTIMFVQTEPVDIQNADATLQKRVSMIGLPDGITVIEPSNATVDVVVPITRIGVRQDLPGQHVQAINLDTGLTATIQPAEIAVTVIGPDAALAALGTGDISAQVDLSGLGPGVYTLEPKVRVPQGITWIASDPITVTVTITSGNDAVSPEQPSPENTISP